jgi:phage minor structural protein
MLFYFFDSSDVLQYTRNDALEAIHTEEEYLFSGIFPMTDDAISRGMRVGFYDQLGVFQLFEVRKVEDDLIDDTQSIEAEHIAIAELLDEIVNVTPTSISAGAAATSVLSGTLWSVGTAVSTDSDSAECKYVSAWESLCTIRDTWSVRIKPRITISGTEISGRYIDIASNVPTNRGVRIEVNKNINQAGVIYDDRGLYTAMIGLGVYDENETALTFTDIVWTAPGDPANKPTGQEWVEDTAATTAYGRNGRKRTGVFYAPEIEDAEELLAATWEYLQTVNTPNVTIDCKIIDLYAYGYEGEQILLGDECNVIIDPLGVERQATVISISRDLLNLEKSDIVLGAYRDDVADMTADNSRASSNVNKIVKSNPDLLNGIINTMVTTILSTGTKMYTDQTDGSLIFETSDGLKAVRITGAGILLASSKVGTVWQWRTAMTGTGMVADEITTGVLRTTLIQILGDNLFYWDSSNIYIIDPADVNKQIRIGKYDGTHYGIAFTTNGGSTWVIALDHTGINADSVTAGTIAAARIDVDNLYVKHLNAADGTFAELVQANPTNAWQKLYFGQYIVSADDQSGVFWGSSKLNRIVLDSTGVLHFFGDAGFQFDAPEGYPLTINADSLVVNEVDVLSAIGTVASNLSTHTSNTSNPHSVTASQLGAVPTSRTVNGHALTGDVSVTLGDLGAVPTSRTVNGHALTGNVTVTASDVGAVPTSRMVNGHALTGDVSVTLADVGGAAASHAHGNLTSDGKIGSTASLFVVTGSGGGVTVSSGLAARSYMRIFYDDTEPESPANGDLWFPAAP